MTFGSRLRERREEKKLTQGQLGKGLGTDGEDAAKSVVYGWEKDKHFPRADQLAMMCERLGCTADFLLFGRVATSDLHQDVAEVAAAINALSERRRSKLLRTIRDLVEDAREVDQLASEAGRHTDDSDARRKDEETMRRVLKESRQIGGGATPLQKKSSNSQ